MKKFNQDIVGNIFGKLFVIKPTRRGPNSNQFYLCKCECGVEKEISRASLLKGYSNSCGCMLKERYTINTIDLKNQKFGYLIVLEKDITKIMDEAFWKCLCDCGSIKSIRSSYLRSGNIKSCGCQKNNLSHKRKYTPWMYNVDSVFRKYNDGNLTIEQFIELSKQNCFYCGISAQNISNLYKNRKTISQEIIKSYEFIYNGLDRINSNQSHNIDNVVPCCKKCNTAKLDYSEEEFKKWITRLYNFYIAKTS